MKKSYPLQNILLVSLLVVMLLVSVCLGLYLYYFTAKEIESNVKNATEATSNIFQNNLNRYFYNIRSLSYTIQNSPVFQEALNTSKSSEFWDQHRSNEEMRIYLQNLSYNYEDMVGIIIIGNNRSVYNYNTAFGFYNRDLLQHGPLEKSLQSAEDKGFVPTFENTITKNDSVKSIFCYYDKIYKDNVHVATLCILIDSQVFSRFTLSNLTSGEKLVLFFNELTIYPQESREMPWKIDALELAESGTFTLGDEEYLCVPYPLSNGWQMVLLLPREKIRASSVSIIQRILSGFLIAFLLYFVCIYFISNYVAQRLKNLRNKMSLVSQRQKSIASHSPILEIDALDKQFTQMTTQIEELLLVVQNEQKEIDHAQLELLRAQINPHFLYNTLDAVNWMAIAKNAEDISEMVSALAGMFRHGLNKGNETTTLANEICHLDQYVYIQKYRHNNGFMFIKNVNPNLLGYQVPIIILQPLVENCLAHGLSDANSFINISLWAHLKDGKLLLNVKDNGVGCNAKEMNLYLCQQNSAKGGYGVKNIHRRLQLRYGADYGLKYIKTKRGTHVTVVLPANGKNGN